MAQQLSAAEVLREIEDAKREVAEARKQYELAQCAVNKARAEFSEADEVRQRCGNDVDTLSSRLDATLSKVLHAPEYVIEFQANIGCYQCYIHLDLTTGATPVLVTSPTTRQVQLRVDNTVVFKAKLAYAVDAKYSSIRIQKDHVHLRLPLTAAAKEDRKAAMTAGMAARTLSRAEIDVKNYAELQCRCCCHAISDPARPFDKVLPLPSSNWMEMVDFWGAAEGAFEHIPKDGIHAAPNRVYVGPADVLVHASNLRAGVAQATVLCPGCNSVVGSQEHPSIGVVLQKHLVQTKETNIFADYTVDNVVVSKLLEVIESEGLFRFELVADGGRRILLQVLSWDATLQSSAWGQPQNVVKVHFSDVPVDGPPSLELAFPPQVLEEVLERLKTSAELLPASLTGLSNLTLGFLFG
ncbi:hypothetical protein ACHHYP_04977 [Achlya hypogyna]|uniref:Uncharacterized protein n=1 Tax=Achlya hypogyna TaxID=1202772 RepID=A0A1V9YZG9_ACHHY|nr:hypothetical protein ACHHYP_04977 [Achlya hypogyna]